MSETLEKVSFRTKPGVSELDFLHASRGLDGWVTRQKGFQYRTVVKTGEGAYIDLVYWATEADAKAAQEGFMSAPQAQPLMALIDPDSVEMAHLPQLQSSCAKVPEPA